MMNKTCKKCGAKVKDALLNCPECGTSLQDSNRSYKKVILFAFIIFNVLMLLWTFYGIGGSTQLVEGANTVAGEEIAKESTILGGSMLVTIWVIGDIVLGTLYFLSGKKS